MIEVIGEEQKLSLVKYEETCPPWDHLSQQTKQRLTWMNPWAASCLCSLFRASFPAMMPVWRPTSLPESEVAVGFHFG